MINIPIISLEVSSMKHVVKSALLDHTAQMDASIAAAVEEFCTPGNIDRIVRSQAMTALDEAVRQEVRNFFSSFGVGRQAVREAVNEYLELMYPIERKKEGP